MSLDLSKLEKPRIKSGKTIARCPACAETGGDSNGDHLFINSDGKFGCVLYQSTDGTEHRKRIFELVGIPEEKPSKPSGSWTALPHAPENAPFPSLKHYKHGMPVAHWIYRTESGLPAGIVARFNLPDGKKETLPLAWCKDESGKTEWRWKSMLEPRPLYNLPIEDDFVVIVEGEKCADAIKEIGLPVTTWAGGSSALTKTDFAPLRGKTVVIWPDNDTPGRRCAESLKSILAPIVAGIKTVPIPEGMPEGWDAADATPEIRQRLIDDATEYFDEPTLEPFIPLSDSPRDRIEGLPFRFLGMDDGVMRYIPDNGQHVVSLSPASHTKLNLIQLAPLQDWESVFPSKNGACWDAASNSLIQMSQSLPRFDSRLIRGRGCWIDGADVIYHAGDRLAISGRLVPIPSYDSPTRSIYEAGLAISVEADHPASNADAAKIIQLCELLSWEQPLYGKLLAGWMALAPVCGALQWRPHVWITGSAGSGKSWIMGNIVNPLVGKSAVFVQGNTSEAGIRCQLGSDALPVLFDEAEAENTRSITRMDGVMELARQSSSESGAGIIKGTATGGSITYMVRSMFCFSSIGVAAVKKADVSRITSLSLRKADDSAQFEAVKAVWRATTADSKFCARVRARSIANAITTRHNAEIFSNVAVSFTGDKRSADQIGTLLAGAYSLTSTKRITPAAAQSWMASQDWSGFKVDALDSDENQCFAHLMSSIIRIERGNSAENVSIDEAVTNCMDANSPDFEAALARNGIKMEENGVFVANNHQALERVFRETAWAGAKWKGQLLRISGAYQAKNAVRFGQNIRQRAVFVPISA